MRDFWVGRISEKHWMIFNDIVQNLPRAALARRRPWANPSIPRWLHSDFLSPNLSRNGNEANYYQYENVTKIMKKIIDSQIGFNLFEASCPLAARFRSRILLKSIEHGIFHQAIKPQQRGRPCQQAHPKPVGQGKPWNEMMIDDMLGSEFSVCVCVLICLITVWPCHSQIECTMHCK